MSTEPRLGTPVELPWWVVPLAIPPLLVAIAAIVLAAPIWAHVVVIAASLLLIAALMRIALRVTSTSMQSVWVSAAYAVWVFIAIVWAVVVATAPHCNCS